MKTQLLEDIGENATLPPTPPRQARQPATSKTAQALPPEPAPDLDLDLDLDSVFEEIAALEAQYQPPAQQHEPALEPTTPLDQPVLTPAEPSFAPQRAQDAAAAHAAPAAAMRHDPLFDFTLPLPEPAASDPDPLTPPPFTRARPKRRYLLWAACALGGALLVQGGWWLYKERKDEGSLAFVATQATQTRQAPQGAPGQALPDAAAAPAAPAPPPLVMLEPDPPAAAAAAQQEKAPPQESHEPEPEPEQVAQQDTAVAPPKPAGRVTRRQSDAAVKPATARVERVERVERTPARQIARAPLMEADSSSAGEGPMSALLRACRAHGYHATQCIRQGCSVTRYGFACRGR